MSQVKICRVHRVLKRNGYCLKCKSEREKARYDADPNFQRRRKRNEYQNKLTQKFTENRMAQTECEHDDALAVEDKDKIPSRQGETDQIYFCPDCGDFINDAGEVVEDPTEEASAPNGGRNDAAPAAASNVQSKHDNQSPSEVQLESVQGNVPAVPAKREGKKLVSETASGNNQAGSGSSASRSVSDKAWNTILDGPWKGLICPNRSLGCEGKMEPYFTLPSEVQGNTYMYRCPKCRAQCSVDFKLATIKQ